MSKEQTALERTAEEILKQELLIALKEDKPDWTDLQRHENVMKALAAEPLFKRCVSNAMKLYARECCQATQKKIAENAKVTFKLDPTLRFAERDSIEIDKSSITNKDNICIL